MVWTHGFVASTIMPLIACVGPATMQSDTEQAAESTGAHHGSEASSTDITAGGKSSGSSSAPTPGDSTTEASTGSDSGSDSDSTGASTTRGTTSSETDTAKEDDDDTSCPPSPACMAGCVVEYNCGDQWRSEQACVDWCDDNRLQAFLFFPPCEEAWEQLSTCIAGLTCEEFAAYRDPTEFPYPCSDAVDNLSDVCAGQ